MTRNVRSYEQRVPKVDVALGKRFIKANNWPATDTLRLEIKEIFEKMEVLFNKDQLSFIIDPKIILILNYTCEKLYSRFTMKDASCSLNTCHNGAVSLMRFMVSCFYKHAGMDLTTKRV
jgi:hypothetical protein